MDIRVPELLTPKIRLVSFTRPTDEMAKLGVNTPLELIAFCARVSNPANQLNSATAAKLIRSLIARKEWSPLEMVDATVELTTARDISRQQLRHRSAVFQEFSQRYADVEGDRHCLREARLEHPTDRQSSVPTNNPELDNEWALYQMEVLSAARRAYEWARKNKIAKECARVVLPEGLTLTDLHMKMSIRSWIHYLELRGANGTQAEHRDIALAIAQAIASIFPYEELLG